MRATALGKADALVVLLNARNPGAAELSGFCTGCTESWRVPLTCSTAASGVGGQPSGQVGRALEVEQGVGQGFELLQRQGLDLGGGGF